MTSLLDRPIARRLGRFLASGVAVQAAYTAAMAAFHLAIGLADQLALALAYSVALAVHFVLNRQWVFVDPERAEGGYALGLSDHGVRYLALAVVVYGVTALSLAVLPGLLGIAPFLAWLLTTFIIGASNFFVLGKLVFR